MCKGSTGRGERNKKNSRRETKVTIAKKCVEDGIWQNPKQKMKAKQLSAFKFGIINVLKGCGGEVVMHCLHRQGGEYLKLSLLVDNTSQC